MGGDSHALLVGAKSVGFVFDCGGLWPTVIALLSCRDGSLALHVSAVLLLTRFVLPTLFFTLTLAIIFTLVLFLVAL